LADSDNQQIAQCERHGKMGDACAVHFIRLTGYGSGCWPRGEIMRGMRIAVVALSLVSAGQSLAEVQLIDNQDGWAPILIIGGTISKSDADYVTQQSDGKYKDKTLVVELDSEGGNVAAAVAIGRIIRRNEWAVVVQKNKKCYSSCALIYIAGVERGNLGVIGLHRPYFAEALDRQEIERTAPILLQRVREYVQSMGIVDSFYEQMVNTGPSEIRLYRGNEITKLVPGYDPTYDEIRNSYDARKYGVTPGVIPILSKADSLGIPKSPAT
jgi:hypothetical protein